MSAEPAGTGEPGRCAATARTVLVDGIPMSGRVAAAARPRAVVVALHGGGVTSAYFDAPAHPRLSLLRAGAALGFTVVALDRPGFGSSAPYAGRMATAASRVDLGYAAIDAFLAGQPRGAGVFLMAHSMGCALALQLAAGPRGGELLGLEIAGIGLRAHPDSMTLLGPLTRGEPGGAGGPARATLRHVLWTPPSLYPADAAAAVRAAAAPGYEGDDVRGWTRSFPGLAARVRVPVRYSLGDHERVWSSGPAALAEVAALFSASPRVVTAEQAGAGHNLSLGLSALAYHLSVLAFAEECALARSHVSPAPSPSPGD